MRLLVTIMAVVFILSLALRMAAAAPTFSDAAACVNDALKFCSHTINNGPIMPDAVKACLRFHEKQLTPRCRAVVRSVYP